MVYKVDDLFESTKRESIMGNSPKFSIITPTLNSEKTLQRTMSSVASQTYNNFEYIIVDGGSDDNTLNIINKNLNIVTNWVSEKDEGIYDAMNKGIKMSQGDFIGIINSDDWYEEDALDNINEILKGETEKNILIHGCIKVFDRDGSFLKKSCSSERKPIHGVPFRHPSMFVSKHLYSKIGLYDKYIKYSADYEFMLRAIQSDCKIICTNDCIANMQKIGKTSGSGSGPIWSERREVLARYFGSKVKGYLFVEYRKIAHFLSGVKNSILRLL